MGGFYERLGEELSLYVRQIAWLNAVPKDDKKRNVANATEPDSRLNKMRAAGIEPVTPEIPAPYLLEYLFEVGPTVSTGMGPAIIGWRDLQAWQEMVGIDLEPWEARMLRKLSSAYLSQSLKSEKPDCPAPYVSQQQIDREAVSRKVGNAFLALMQSKR